MMWYGRPQVEVMSADMVGCNVRKLEARVRTVKLVNEVRQNI